MHPNEERKLLSGWGRTSATSAFVRTPRSTDEIVEALACPAARGVISRGLGRSYGDAAQNAGGVVCDMTALAAVRNIDLMAGTVTADAGVSLGTLMRALLPLGCFIPVSPGTQHVTIGGAIASDVHGKNHHRDGSFCDHVTTLKLATPSGLRRVTPNDDPDIFSAIAGGMGLAGIVVEATIRLIRVTTSWVRMDTDRADNLDDTMDLMERGDANYRYSVAWIDCLSRGGRLGRSVITRANHAEPDDLPPRLRRDSPEFVPRSPLPTPMWVPQRLASRIGARSFNEVWFRRAPKHERGTLRSIRSYFCPLDAVRDWNRLYGFPGLIQYHFVVPFGAEDVLLQILERFSATGFPSFLAVLKRLGDGRGLLSFPLPGWTLALDIPARLPELGPFLDSVDELVAAAGGRVYLAKDSRLRHEMMEAMYPELNRWREIRTSLDPGEVMRSDLDRRLGLTGVVGPG